MIKVAIVGAAGFSGMELIRILSLHPQVTISCITSRTHKGKKLSDVFSNFFDLDLEFSDCNKENLAACELVFFATPNLIAMEYVPYLLEKGVKVIDLSADFRLKNIASWEQYYNSQHSCSELVARSVYGLSEVYSEQIASADLVANPGCYPTAVQLGLWPLLENNLIQLDNIIADVKSGVSGAGRSLKDNYLYCNANESLAAYNIGVHRHTPEIVQGLNYMSQQHTSLLFVPHLVPMNRGIHATIYAQLIEDTTDIQALYQQFYAHKQFVQVLGSGVNAKTSDVAGTNNCMLSITQLDGQLVVCAVIDNLIKGAAGQAVQNMNIIYGLPEHTGLQQISFNP